MSDQLPPPGGPDEDQPAALIPSRAARHQQKRGLRRGRPAKPAAADPSSPEPPRREPRVRPVPDLPSGEPATGGQPEEPGEPRRRPALKAP